MEIFAKLGQNPIANEQLGQNPIKSVLIAQILCPKCKNPTENPL